MSHDEEQGGIEDRCLPPAPPRKKVSRRGFFSVLALGWLAFGAAAVGLLGAVARFLFPNVLHEPPQELDAGDPEDFAVGRVDERFKESHGVWIVREEGGFYALSAVCTHLGCTPNWIDADEKFKCPCHGSGFLRSGVNVEGPAPRPLERYRIVLAEDGRISIDKNTRYRQERGQWEREGAYPHYP